MEKGCISGSSVWGAAFIGKFLSFKRTVRQLNGLQKALHLQIVFADIELFLHRRVLQPSDLEQHILITSHLQTLSWKSKSSCELGNSEQCIAGRSSRLFFAKLFITQQSTMLSCFSINAATLLKYCEVSKGMWSRQIFWTGCSIAVHCVNFITPTRKAVPIRPIPVCMCVQYQSAVVYKAEVVVKFFSFHLKQKLFSIHGCHIS